MCRWCLALVLLVLAAPPRADEVRKPETHRVPFRLTETKHVLLRARINGKGPFNFIMDTGAPALFVSTAVCKKLGIEPGKDGWGTFDRFEIEGGVVVPKAKGKIADPFQLEGMNQLGLAGTHLHGVIGYNLLARYKIELDFTRDKMAWTRLAFNPELPEGLDGKAAGGVDAMAGLAKMMALLVGKRAEREIKLRGFFGLDLADKDGTVSVTAVLKESPAAEAGLKAGDRLTHWDGKEVQSAAAVRKLAAGLAAGTTVPITIVRGQETRQVTLQAGKGF